MMKTRRTDGQAPANPQLTDPRQVSPAKNAKPLVLQVTVAKASFKNASVQALSILTAAEVRELLACEEVIAKGWDTFVAVGHALATVREKRLYRADFDTFEAYCRQKWYYGKSHTYRLIGAAQVIEFLSPIGDVPLPRNESQVRPLLGLKVDEVQAVWREVIKKARKKNVTAKLVKETAARFRQGAGPSCLDGKPAPTDEKVRCAIAQAEKLLNEARLSLEAGDVGAAVRRLGELRTGLRL